MTRIVHVSGFLGERRRRRLLGLLDDQSLAWRRSGELGRTGSGSVLQLASEAARDVPAMKEVTASMASWVYQAVECHRPGALPPPDHLDVQVFPVRMTGCLQEPPSHSAHRDTTGSAHPVITAISYLIVEGAVGGDLLLFNDDVNAGPTTSISPATGDLVVMDGDQLHAVAPLLSGSRVSVVTNFYT